MKGISTVSILILTVFLSISVLPACADPIPPSPPVIVFGHVEGGDDGTITITANGNSLEVPAGSYGKNTPGYWKADLSDIGVSNGGLFKVLVVSADGSTVGDATCIANAFSPYGMAPATPVSDGNGGSSSGGDGTYPPGWGETPTPTPTPDATVEPTSTDTTEPVTPPGEEVAVTPTETATEDETDTITPMNTDPESPGFGAVFMIAGLLAAVYLVFHRRE